MKKLLVFILLLSACNAHNKLDKLNWLQGTWEMRTNEGSFTEVWKKESDTLWSGTGKFVSGDKQVFSEHLQLVLRNGKIFYIAAVPDQNNGQPVLFEEKAIKEDEVMFENLSHDWPQQIIYRKLSDTSFVGIVQGTERGQQRKEEFHFSKQ